jgi:hypothetical protein
VHRFVMVGIDLTIPYMGWLLDCATMPLPAMATGGQGRARRNNTRGGEGLGSCLATYAPVGELGQRQRGRR